MRVIDAHTHIFPEKIAIKASESIGHFYDLNMSSDASSKSLLEKEAVIGTEHILVCSSALSPLQVASINDFIASECKAHSEFIGFAAMHRDLEGYEEELDRALGMGLTGVKFHNDMQQFDIDDEKMLPIYRAIAKRGMKVLFHMGDDRYDFSSPKRMEKIAKLNPDLTILAAHFGGYRRWEESLHVEKLENVYFDTSSSLAFLDDSMALRLIDRFGADHFFWGSDFPMWNPADELKRFLSLDLDDETKEMITYYNFAKLFGI